MHAAAGRRGRLILAGQPVHLFARAVAFDFEFRPAHVPELDLDGIAGIHRHEAFVKSASGDDVAGIEPEYRVNQAIWLGILCAMAPVL